MSSGVVALKSRDAMTKVVTKCGGYRLVTVSCSTVLRETIQRHRLMEVTNSDTNFLERVGQVIAFTNCLAATLQKEERVELKYETSEGCTAAVDSLALGECRARVCDSSSDAGGPHTLRVSRILYNRAQPVLSVTQASVRECAARVEAIVPRHMPLTPDALHVLCESHLDNDFTPHALNFMAKSEGSPETALFLGAVVDPATDTLACCGAMLQPIALGDAAVSTGVGKALLHAAVMDPSSGGGVLRRLVQASAATGLLHQSLLTLMTGDGAGAVAACSHTRQLTSSAAVDVSDAHADLMQQALGLVFPSSRAGTSPSPLLRLDPTSAEKSLLDFFCRCSKADLLQHMRSLPPERLDGLRRQGTLESTCAMCKRVHTIDAEDWKGLLS